MCGIAGIYHYAISSKINLSELHDMSDYLRVRGPDGEGMWLHTNEMLGFAHRRLSIIDLSEHANQPLHLEDKLFSIVFNGEIYNYQKLREALLQKGCIFRTHSDTEIVLKLYQLYGADMLSRLRGMFAFAIWDEKNKALFCARDQFGIKPFYFSDDGKKFYFCSQVKALLHGAKSSLNTHADAAGQIGFLLLGSVPEPHTLYEGIESLPAGHYLVIQNGKRSCRQYYSIKNAFINAENNPQDANTISDALYDTVWHHLVSDVEVGIFLSAGIDSSTLANIGSELSQKKLHTVTLGFQEYKNTRNDETPLAELAAKTFQTKQHTQWITKTRAHELREKILHAMDQPSIDGMNTYFVSMIARDCGLKVALSGLGADEIFFGYPHFSRIPIQLRFLKPFFKTGKYIRHITKNILHHKKASLIEYSKDMASAYFFTRAIHFPWELSSFVDCDRMKAGLEKLNLLERFKKDIDGIQSLHFQISALEMQWYMRNQLLRDSDWAGMANSLEIRVPFVDVTFFETCIHQMAYQMIDKKRLANAAHYPLPLEIIHRKKTGFNIPTAQWFLEDVAPRTLQHYARFIYRQFT